MQEHFFPHKFVHRVAAAATVSTWHGGSVKQQKSSCSAREGLNKGLMFTLFAFVCVQILDMFALKLVKDGRVSVAGH